MIREYKINLLVGNRSISKYRCETSHNGHSLSVVKSAFQKYIRRGIFSKALYWVLQGFLIPEKRIRSTIINRLIIILTEDISINESHLIPRSHHVLERFRTDASKEIPDKVDVEDLVMLIYDYCEAKKSRLGSNIVNFYTFNKSVDYPDRFPASGETFKSLLQTCLSETDLEKRLKIFKFICKSSDLVKTKSHCKDFIIPSLQSELIKNKINSPENDKL